MRVWAIANQKGGVGKTTSTLALGRMLVARGMRVLLVDLDPHASLTRAFGVPGDPQPAGVLDLFASPPATLAGLARPAPVEGLAFVCAQTALATLERRSASQPGLGLQLSQAITRHSGDHDAVLLDCPPTLGLLMVNALAAADRLIVPTQCEPLALHGLAGMCRTAAMVERSRQRPLPVSILPTLYDRRTRAGRDTLHRLQQDYRDRVWSDAIPIDTQLSNADLLAQQPAVGDSGRAMPAYGRALDWLLDEAATLEDAA
ncbi:ParA family protein [Luteimonas abyssi]|uniref:ParA family protein n=1 Tax=Luteimonas abyssi TaxID=1247514 RepID=UPI000737ACA7|nr:ParA family protein [Luteimonas abyssi]